MSLDNFIGLGQEILKTDPIIRYGPSASTRALQPGFMPLSGVTRLAVVNLNPSVGKRLSAQRPTEIDRETAAYERWAREGNRAAYEAAYRAWLSNVELWDTSKRWVLPVLERLRIAVEEIAWLNVVKLSSQGIEEVRAHLTSDLTWLEQQLGFVKPQVVLVGGKKVSEAALPVLKRTVPGRFCVQSRPRDLHGASLAAAHDKTAECLQRLLV